MPNTSRDRHLAKNAERRRIARQQAKRNRNTALAVGGAIALILVAVVVLGILNRNDGTVAASPSTSISVGGGKGPTQAGTVDPQPPPQKTVACGADVPAAATKPKPQFDRAPTVNEALDKDTEYTAVLHTSCGDVTIALDRKAAPKTVASFVFLAERGYFDGTYVHRVVDSIDVVQGGDPTGSGGGGPGYSIPDELTGTQHYAPGTIAMANAGAGTGGSQFFLITGPDGANLDANPAYTIFGSITEGLDVAQQINALMPTNDGSYDGPPTKAVYLDKVTIESKKAPPSPSGHASPSPSG